MPLYEYRCDRCGEFEAWRRLSELDTPMSCSSCQGIAKRIFSPPMVNLNSGSLSLGNKKEPKVVKTEQKTAEKPRSQPVTNSRPWMISHGPPRY